MSSSLVVGICRFVGFVILMVALLVQPMPVAAASVDAVRTGTEPGKYSVRASRFAANEFVSVKVFGPNETLLKLGDEEADARGNLRFSIRLPRFLPAGEWTVVLRGHTSKKHGERNFTVPPPELNAGLTAEPATGSLTTTFTFSSPDFQAGESVSFWLVDPNGQAIAGGESTVSEAGQLVIAFQAAEGAPIGGWLMNAYGSQSDRLAAVGFSITEEPAPTTNG